jgi:hypothetical protein
MKVTCFKSLCLILSSIIAVIGLSSGVVIAQELDFEIEKNSVRSYTPEELASSFKKLTGDAQWKKLMQEATRRGFKANYTKETMWGQTATLLWEKQPSTKGDIKMLELQHSKSKDAAALVYVSDGKKTYKALLIAFNGDFLKNTKEYYVKKKGKELIIVEAHSWWSCMRGKLPKCGRKCLNALGSCSGGWIRYIICLFRKCGWCFLKSAWRCR